MFGITTTSSSSSLSTAAATRSAAPAAAPKRIIDLSDRKFDFKRLKKIIKKTRGATKLNLRKTGLDDVNVYGLRGPLTDHIIEIDVTDNPAITKHGYDALSREVLRRLGIQSGCLPESAATSTNLSPLKIEMPTFCLSGPRNLESSQQVNAIHKVLSFNVLPKKLITLDIGIYFNPLLKKEEEKVYATTITDDFLQKTSNVKNFFVDWGGLTTAEIRMLCNAVSGEHPVWPNLQELTLYGHVPNQEAMALWMELIAHSSKLIKLEITTDVDIHEKTDITLLADALRRHQKLEELVLPCSKNDIEMQALATAFRANQRLRSLTLCSRGRDADMGAALYTLIAHPTLTSLTIEPFGRENMLVTTYALTNIIANPSCRLTHVKFMSFVKLTPANRQALLVALASNETITEMIVHDLGRRQCQSLGTELGAEAEHYLQRNRAIAARKRENWQRAAITTAFVRSNITNALRTSIISLLPSIAALTDDPAIIPAATSATPSAKSTTTTTTTSSTTTMAPATAAAIPVRRPVVPERINVSKFMDTKFFKAHMTATGSGNSSSSSNTSSNSGVAAAATSSSSTANVSEQRQGTKRKAPDNDSGSRSDTGNNPPQLR
jgi:hypothetical protein